MNRKREYEDRELQAAFSSLRRLKAPERAVRRLSERLEREQQGYDRRKRGAVPLLRMRRQVLIAVFATLLIAVPLTFGVTKRFTADKALSRTYVVRFIYEDEKARSVHLVGDFNSWRSNEVVLERVGDSKLWSVELTLEEGLYKYGFLVNGTYIVSDPFSGLKVKDSQGNESSLMVLAGVQGNGGSL
jgi:hypothetical protein